MVKIEKNKLKQGMVLAENITGKNNVSIKAGTTLSERYINILKNGILFSLTHILVTEESYNTTLLKSTDGLKTDVEAIEKAISPSLLEKLGIKEVGEENYVFKSDLKDVHENMNVLGDLLISGNVENCSLIQVSGDLTIVGDIINSNIITKGNITIQRDINNSYKQFKINSFGSLTANHVKNAIINSHSINIKSSIANSEITATNSIEAPSAMHIQNSTLQAANNILLGSVKQKTTLIIFSEKQMRMVKNILEIEKKLQNFEKEIEPLKQSIKVFQILRNKVNELPDIKRKELINNVRMFKQQMEKRKSLKDQFVTLKVKTAEIKESRVNNPIVIEEEIEKGTKVVIDNSSFVVQMKEKGVVFYKKGIIIMGKKNKEWGRIL